MKAEGITDEVRKAVNAALVFRKDARDFNSPQFRRSACADIDHAQHLRNRERQRRLAEREKLQAEIMAFSEALGNIIDFASDELSAKQNTYAGYEHVPRFKHYFPEHDPIAAAIALLQKRHPDYLPRP
jgi:hypothetical protein